MAGPPDGLPSTQRVFQACFGISVCLHLSLLIGQAIAPDWFHAFRIRRAINVVYEYEQAERELEQLQDQLRRTQRDTVAAPAPSEASDRTQIRIPDRPALTAADDLADIMPGRSAIVDLTNLIDASRGDPVLLSYFSAIRMQIQQTASGRVWLGGIRQGGIVYVAFVLQSSGVVERVSILSDRSSAPGEVREVALRIVRTSAPFPPFPPSIQEPNKTIIVPLEFLLGGA